METLAWIIATVVVLALTALLVTSIAAIIYSLWTLIKMMRLCNKEYERHDKARTGE